MINSQVRCNEESVEIFAEHVHRVHDPGPTDDEPGATASEEDLYEPTMERSTVVSKQSSVRKNCRRAVHEVYQEATEEN